ncbi:uncharacterized protein METZ01_LOCUS111771 [marine metagenome]|uniref:Uncharacterized protein n=1 Tax=marine metagenome TaxID=408172 RepID=A0A381X409_9ZZZZ
MANPHGFTVETIPAAKAKPSGVSSPIFPRKSADLDERFAMKPFNPPVTSPPCAPRAVIKAIIKKNVDMRVENNIRFACVT